MNTAAATQTPAANVVTSSTSSATARRFTALRRTPAGVVAASAIAFGGAGMLSATEASAAGVRTQTYVVQAQPIQVESGSSTPARGSL